MTTNKIALSFPYYDVHRRYKCNAVFVGQKITSIPGKNNKLHCMDVFRAQRIKRKLKNDQFIFNS